MQRYWSRRDWLRLAALGGAVFVSGARSALAEEAGKQDDFYFVQMSDVHWGFEGPEANPDPRGTFPKAIDAVNALPEPPDFIFFTGDLTHTTDDPFERRKRMSEFKSHVERLKVKNVRFTAGEHDASLDRGKAFRELFGAPNYTFEHKGVHFIVLDNVSDPSAQLGDAQLDWLAGELAKLDKDSRIVVFTHRPLFDLYPQWDWATRDGDKAVKLLMPYRDVTVFYGHIHQEHHFMTGHIPHHAAKGLMFALPAPGSQPKRAPVPWNADAPYRNLGFRDVDVERASYDVAELPIVRA